MLQKSTAGAQYHMIGVIEDADFYQLKPIVVRPFLTQLMRFPRPFSLNFADFSKHV
jgi:hypothetical protein